MLAVNLGSTLPNLKSKIKEYLTRAELLKKTIGKVICNFTCEIHGRDPQISSVRSNRLPFLRFPLTQNNKSNSTLKANPKQTKMDRR